MSQFSPATLSKVRIAFCFVCFFIVYGSLYPFEFKSTVSSELIDEFRRSWRYPSGLGDTLGNIALYIPCGFLGCLLFGHQRSLRRALLPLITIWAGLAVGTQVAQLYLPSRSPSLFDVCTNGIGFLIGIVAASPAWVRSAIDINDRGLLRNGAVILIAAWLSGRLLPFVPTIDWQAYKDALKPLLLAPRFAWPEFLLITLCWLVAARLGESILIHRWRWLYLPIGIAVVLCLEVIIVRNEITMTDVCAAVAAILLWPAISRSKEKMASVLAWLLLASFAMDAIFPFAMRSDPVPFNWLLLSGFLDGSMLINASAFCEKLFVFGAILWLLKEARSLSLPTIVTVTSIVAAIEIGQIWISGRTPELTDPVLVVFIAWLLRQEGDAPGALSAEYVDEVGAVPASVHFWQGTAAAGARILREHTEPYSSPENLDEYLASFPAKSAYDRSRRHRNVVLAAGCACLATILATYVVVRLPGMPYNVRELFLFGGNGIDLFFFSLALLGLGWGSAWVGKLTAHSRIPALRAQLGAVAVSIVVYILLTFSITRESIGDVAGASVVVHRVGVRGVLGQNGIDLVASIGADKLRAVTDLFEPVIRFGTLIGPLVIFLGIILATLIRQARDPAGSRQYAALAFVGRLAFYLLLALPWLYFCKLITFDWSSTDNLNELIAPDGLYGLGGGGFLYALTALITLCAGLLAWSTRHRKRYVVGVMLMSVAAVPVGWWLLNAGLSDHVTKYELVFSGVDFLLGPDRQQLISSAELFWRWSFVQLCAVTVLAFGAALYLAWTGEGAESMSAQHHGPDQRMDSARIYAASELEVRLDNRQLNFLASVTQELGGTLPSTINAVIDYMQQEIQRTAELEARVYALVRNPSSTATGDLNLVSQYVDLSKQRKTFVLELRDQSGVRASQAVSRLIDIFISVSEEETIGMANTQPTDQAELCRPKHR